MFRFVCSFVCVVAACGNGGSSSMMGDDEPPTDGGGPNPQTLDPADCTAFAVSFAAAGDTCGTPLPGGGQAAFEQWCKKGIDAAEMCGGDPAAGLDCFATQDANDWECVGSLGPYPACNGDLSASLGALCLIALGNPQCASGIRCQFDADCSTGMVCNEATEQCMSKTAYCVGLPCDFDADCPDGHTCNDAEGACIGE